MSLKLFGCAWCHYHGLYLSLEDRHLSVRGRRVLMKSEIIGVTIRGMFVEIEHWLHALRNFPLRFDNGVAWVLNTYTKIGRSVRLGRQFVQTLHFGPVVLSMKDWSLRMTRKRRPKHVR